MPRPPTLPALEWIEIFDKSSSYDQWLQSGEETDKIEKIERSRQDFVVDVAIKAYLENLPKPVNVLVIAEDWCGDVVRHVPIVQKLIDAGTNIKSKYCYREQFPEVFVRYLTNGGEAIPKFIFFNQDFVECGNWGPMPQDCRDIIARGKACGNVGHARQIVGKFYEADSSFRHVTKEILALIDIASTDCI